MPPSVPTRGGSGAKGRGVARPLYSGGKGGKSLGKNGLGVGGKRHRYDLFVSSAFTRLNIADVGIPAKSPRTPSMASVCYTFSHFLYACFHTFATSSSTRNPVTVVVDTCLPGNLLP